MRILVVSDIHANWAALQAVREPHDVCLCLGDLVEYGCEPVPCVDWVREHAHYCVRGNHDHGTAQRVRVRAGATGLRYLTGVTRELTVPQIGEDRRRFLARLPTSQMLTLAGRRFLLVHATPRDPLDEYAPGEVAFWEKQLSEVDADVVCVGHTHKPYCLTVGGRIVLNPGSVGQPRFGDPRACYAVIEGDSVEVKRVEYDVEAAVRAAAASPLPETAKRMLAELYRTGRATVSGILPSLDAILTPSPNGHAGAAEPTRESGEGSRDPTAP